MPKPRPKLYLLWRALTLTKRYYRRGRRFAIVARKYGLARAVAETRAPGISLGTATDAIVADDRYQYERDAEAERVAGKLAGVGEPEALAFLREHGITDLDRVVVYPVSYPPELTQRPDHVLRAYAERGYRCIMLSLEGNQPQVETVGPGILRTNRYAEVLRALRDRPAVFYLTYPFFRFLQRHLPRAVVHYDVVDDLSVFSRHCHRMLADHHALLRSAAVTTFSSHELLEANRDVVRHPHLLTNGVWASDFAPPADKVDLRAAPDELVVGYHGAISELLDWELLARLADTPGLRLVLVGPLAEFDAVAAAAVRATRDRVLASPRVVHVPAQPYRELPRYLAGFDVGVVPFILSDKTHPVSPLKMFEYLASGLPVMATPTRTLERYRDDITVAPAAEWPSLLTTMRAERPARRDHARTLAEVDWGAQAAPVIDAIEREVRAPARRVRSRRVDILNVNFFDWDGEVLYKGGAERYVFDLARLMAEDGWEPRILQNAKKPFVRDHRGVPVIGVATGLGYDLRGISGVYKDYCNDADLLITSPAELACQLDGKNVIGINHGIYWDHGGRKLDRRGRYRHDNVFDALAACRATVAVDTNFANWVRTFDYGLAKNIVYVPNYWDRNDFSAPAKSFDGKLRVIYPRRLYEPRGIFLTIKAFETLFPRHPQLELYLVGQANEQDTRAVRAFMDRFPGRVAWDEFDMHEMQQAYRDTHIALIPTLWSEGTSLSCLEAMATGHAVVATNIGGLPNLVTDGYNGLLINPSVEALINAVETLVADRSLIARMARHGIDLASVFEKAHWDRRWRSVLAMHGAVD